MSSSANIGLHLPNAVRRTNMKYSLSQKAFIATLITLLGTIIAQVYKGVPVNYEGMAMFLGAVGAVYWGRSKTKADNDNKEQ